MKFNFFFKAVLVSVVFWFAESALHKYVFGHSPELFPTDINELWMRSIIVMLLIAFGIYADVHAQSLLRKEEEKRAVFNATVTSTQHILNNLLSQMEYFKIQAEQSKALDPETINQYNNSMKEGIDLVTRLGAVSELTAKEIRRSVHPT